MDDAKSDRARTNQLHARQLANETGITEAQALDLIDLIGTDRPSLLREARILKSREKPPEQTS